MKPTLRVVQRHKEAVVPELMQPSHRGREKKHVLRKQPKLESLQRWVQEVITHPDGVDAGINSKPAQKEIRVQSESLSAVIRPSSNLDSHQRIGIYAGMYFMRLMECLSNDFTAVRHALGFEQFDEVAKAYVAAHPSTHYSLNVFGAKFSKFLLKKKNDIPERNFLSELAVLEWAIQEVFDERRLEPLTPAKLGAISPDQLGDAAFKISPALRLFKFEYPVNRYLQAVYDERKATIPKPVQNWLVVYRKGFRVWRARLTEPQYHVLTALQSGTTLSGALELVCATTATESEQIIGSINAWFKEWATEGLFVGVRFKRS